MFFSNDDDDNDFMSPSGSKLASLFGGSNTASENESLRYTAPKEPKKKKPDGDEGNKSANQNVRLLCAVAVHSYKLIDGKFDSQGKLGVAVLANSEENEYKVLLYKGKQQPVTQAIITPAFVLTVQKNNYATLYDDTRQTWSLNFESSANLDNFAKQVCIAKAASYRGGVDALVSQDLSYGEGGQLENGDSVEMKYSAWLFEGTALGAEIDTDNGTVHVSRFKLGRGKVIKGWDEGLLGMRKSGCRLLVVPPSLGGGSEMKGKVPANSTVAYHIEVTRVKLAKERETASPRENVTPSHTPTPPEQGEQTSGENIQREQNPAGEQSGAQSNKARLLSRIAKMGQPMLPGMSGGQAEGEKVPEQTAEDPASPMKPDIPTKPTVHPASQSTTHVASHPATHQPVNQPTYQPVSQPVAFQPVIQPSYTPLQHPVPNPMSSQLALYQSNPQLPMQYGGQYGGPPPPQYGGMYGQPYQPAPPPPQAPAAPASTAASSEVVLSETRQNNTEVRLSLSKVVDKLEKIHDRVEGISAHQAQQSASVMPNMEAGVLLHNITRIVQENDRLKNELFEKNGRIEHQNEKINELIQRNQKENITENQIRYIEQSNTMLEQRSDTFKLTATQSQDKVLTLEQDKVKLTSELSACTSQLSNLQLEITALKKRDMEVKQQLDGLLTSDQDQKTELSVLRVNNAENEKKVEQFSSQLKDERRRKKELETQLANLQEEQSELQNNYHTLERSSNERKKKFSEERQKLEQEMEEIKSSLEAEISVLKERLKKQKSSTDVMTAEQITKMEENLDKEWKEKSDRLLANAQDRHKRALAEVEREKTELEGKISSLEQKLTLLKSSRGEADGHMLQLKEELEDMKIWKDKYDNLRSQATVMKERFEARISELEKDVETVTEERQKTIEKARQAHTVVQSQLLEVREHTSEWQSRAEEEGKKVQQLTAKLEQLRSQQVAGAAGESGLSQEDVNTEVKKVMSSVYSSMSSKFKPKQSYSGTNVQQTMLTTIKTVTLSLLSGGDLSTTQEQEDSETEEEEEETEDEESSDKEDEAATNQSSVDTIKSAKDKQQKTQEDTLKAESPPVVSAAAVSASTDKVDNDEEKPEKELPSEEETEETSPGVGVSECKQEVSPNTGKHGNPHYAAEITEAGKDECEDKKSEPPKKRVKSRIDTSPPKSLSSKSKIEKSTDTKKVSSVKERTGSAAKEKATVATRPTLVKTKTQTATGGRGGNPHYMAELNRGVKKDSTDHKADSATKSNAPPATTNIRAQRPIATKSTPRPLSTGSASMRHSRNVNMDKMPSTKSGKPVVKKDVTDQTVTGHKTNTNTELTKSKLSGSAMSRSTKADTTLNDSSSKITVTKARPTSDSSKPGSTSSRPSSSSSRPQSTSSRPSSTSSSRITAGGLSSRPNSTYHKSQSTSSRPGSTSSRPGSTSSRPGSTSARPESTSSRPGSSSSQPGSTSSRPGSTSAPASISNKNGSISSRTSIKSTRTSTKSAGSSNDKPDGTAAKTKGADATARNAKISSRPTARILSETETNKVNSTTRPTSNTPRLGSAVPKTSSVSSRPGSVHSTKQTTNAQGDPPKESTAATVKSLRESKTTQHSTSKPFSRHSSGVNGKVSEKRVTKNSASQGVQSKDNVITRAASAKSATLKSKPDIQNKNANKGIAEKPVPTKTIVSKTSDSVPGSKTKKSLCPVTDASTLEIEPSPPEISVIQEARQSNSQERPLVEVHDEQTAEQESGIETSEVVSISHDDAEVTDTQRDSFVTTHISTTSGAATEPDSVTAPEEQTTSQDAVTNEEHVTNDGTGTAEDSALAVRPEVTDVVQSRGEISNEKGIAEETVKNNGGSELWIPQDESSEQMNSVTTGDEHSSEQHEAEINSGEDVKLDVTTEESLKTTNSSDIRNDDQIAEETTAVEHVGDIVEAMVEPDTDDLQREDNTNIPRVEAASPAERAEDETILQSIEHNSISIEPENVQQSHHENVPQTIEEQNEEQIERQGVPQTNDPETVEQSQQEDLPQTEQGSVFPASDSDSDEDLFKPIPKSLTESQQKSQEDVDDGEDEEEVGVDKSEVVTEEAEQKDEEDDLFKPIPKTKEENPEKVEEMTEPADVDPLFGDNTVLKKSDSVKKPVGSVKKPTSVASIFDDEEDDGDLFGGSTGKSFGIKPKTSYKKEKAPKKEESSDSDDVKEKPPPPPLFGDDEDDDDLDWFSK